MKQIGIYGGTFSPPHLGHTRAARIFLEDGGIDALMVIPPYVTPLKERVEQTSPDDRLAMCRKAFAFSEKITVSDMEIRREGKSYTSETLLELSSSDTRLSFLCGTDMFLTMGSWHAPETIFRLATVVCMRRESDTENTRLLSEKAEEYRLRFGAEVKFLNAPPLSISSSEIRARLKIGADCSDYLDESVLQYIRQRGLYL